MVEVILPVVRVENAWLISFRKRKCRTRMGLTFITFIVSEPLLTRLRSGGRKAFDSKYCARCSVCLNVQREMHGLKVI